MRPHRVVPLGSDGHLVPGCQVVELPHLTAPQTLGPAVRHAVLTVQAEQTVVAAGAVVAAGVETPGVVRRRVLQTGGQTQVLLVSQADLAPDLPAQSPRPRLAAVLALGQDGEELCVDEGGQGHAGGGGSQLGRGRGRSRALQQTRSVRVTLPTVASHAGFCQAGANLCQALIKHH